MKSLFAAVSLLLFALCMMSCNAECPKCQDCAVPDVPTVCNAAAESEVAVQNQEKVENRELATDVESLPWKSIKPSDIKDNPYTLIFDDWMALAAGKKDDMNAMTIAWGGFGYLWNKPVVTIYVSESRYTYDFVEKNDYFTVTAFPQNEKYKKALQYIGTHSGRDGDKLTEAGLTPEFTELGNPIFKQARLAIECKMIYKKAIELDDVPDFEKQRYEKMKIHHMYIGEIVNVWEK